MGSSPSVVAMDWTFSFLNSAEIPADIYFKRTLLDWMMFCKHFFFLTGPAGGCDVFWSCSEKEISVVRRWPSAAGTANHGSSVVLCRILVHRRSVYSSRPIGLYRVLKWGKTYWFYFLGSVDQHIGVLILSLFTHPDFVLELVWHTNCVGQGHIVTL